MEKNLAELTLEELKDLEDKYAMAAADSTADAMKRCQQQIYEADNKFHNAVVDITSKLCDQVNPILAERQRRRNGIPL